MVLSIIRKDCFLSMQKISSDRRSALSTTVAVVAIIVIIAVVAGAVLLTSQHGSSSTSTSPTSTITTSSSSSSSASSSVSSVTSMSSTSAGTNSSSSASQSSTTQYSGRLIVSFATPSTPVAASNINVTYPVTVTGLGNVPGSVALQPATTDGVSVNFSPQNISLTTQIPVTATVSVSSSVKPGSYTVQTVATGGGGSLNVSLTVQVVQFLVATEPQFTPGNLTIPLGSTVTWVRLNGVLGEHGSNGSQNIVFTNNMTSSPQLLQYQSWSYTFNQAGIFPYTSTYTAETGEITVDSS